MLEPLLFAEPLDYGAGASGLASIVAATLAPASLRPIRVGIASAIRLVHEGLSIALKGRAGIAEVRTFGLDREGLAAAARAAPDVVLVDLSATDPESAASAVKTACPQARLVAFALTELDHNVFACAASGFAGYVPQDGGADELHAAVLDAMHGRLRCAPHIAAAMFRRLGALLRPAPAARPISHLTARENEVLMLADQGRSNKEIARLLHISNATVKNHMHSILQKLQVDRRGQATVQLRRKDAANGY